MTTPPDQTRPVKPVSELLRGTRPHPTLYNLEYTVAGDYADDYFPKAVALLEEVMEDECLRDIFDPERPKSGLTDMIRAYLAALRHEVAGNGQEIES